MCLSTDPLTEMFNAIVASAPEPFIWQDSIASFSASFLINIVAFVNVPDDGFPGVTEVQFAILLYYEVISI